jgi:cytochrome c oxidase cbb3-type subunit 3
MADFDSGIWSVFVAGATLVSIVACGVLLAALSKRKVATDPDKTGHVWDEDLDELNNPLPMWWIWLFWITIVFSVAYLWYYPGLGSFQGSGKWSSAGQYAEEVQVAQWQHGPLYARLAAADIPTLSTNPEARVVGQRLFLNYCSQCHASDARGTKGFPNLTDKDWLYGGEPDVIKASILDGRAGVMPAMGAALGGEAGAKEVANYVRSLSGLQHDAAAAALGKEKFAACAACHGPEARGNPALGAPNLTDGTWLYGCSLLTITETIFMGWCGLLPAHRVFVGLERAHILAV